MNREKKYPPRILIAVRVKPAVHRKFARIAAENRRSMGAEAALLIEAHIAAEKEKKP